LMCIDVLHRFETSVTSHAGLVHSLIASSCSSLKFAMSNGWVTSGGVLTSGLLAVPQGQLRGLLPVLQRATPELPDQLGRGSWVRHANVFLCKLEMLGNTVAEHACCTVHAQCAQTRWT
jgi:hypothetical protein